MSDVNKSEDSKDEATQKVTIYIDEVAYQVNPSNNLLAGVLSQKLNLPYFCWHPSMGSVGACRQCAVTQYQDDKDTRGRLVMACTTPVSEGMRISLKDPQSSQFREQIIGAMMTNHPHDCPVCAEGGECHLQDMTVMTGHTERTYAGKKRTFTNQYLGDLVGHEMNRCITCYRCVRFYHDYAGGKDFGVYGSKNQVYFGRQRDGQLESEFSGNLVEVCPTGVFTNKLFSAHYTRKWDLQSSPSICAHCAIGCNTSIGERYGSVRRVVNRYYHDINGYFLCDRGRYGIGFVNGEQRITTTKGIKQQSAEKLTSLDVAKSLVHFRGEKFIGIGSARASLEANFLLKNLVGNQYFCAGYSDNEMRMVAQHRKLLQAFTAPSLHEIEKSDFVFIIGEDITQTSPRMALAVRQALRNASIKKAASIGIPSWQDSAVRTVGGNLVSPLFSLQSMATKLDDVCERKLLLTPADISEMVLKVTQAIEVKIQQKAQVQYQENSEKPPVQQHFVDRLLECLITAKRPLLITGWSLQSAGLLAAVQQLMSVLSSELYIKTLKEQMPVQLAVLPPQNNSVGLMSLIDLETLSTNDVLSYLQQAQADSVILLEQELAHFSEQQLSELKKNTKTLMVLEHSESQVSRLADIVLPVAAVSEDNGHYVNYQGLIQRYHQTHASVLPIQESWRWLDLIAKSLFTQGWKTRQTKSMDQLKSLADLHQLLLTSFNGWPIKSLPLTLGRGVARQTHRASGRTSQMANINVHEAKTTESYEASLRFSMEGKPIGETEQLPFVWSPGWNSNQAITQFQVEVSGELRNTSQQLFIDFEQAECLFEQWPLLQKSATLSSLGKQIIGKPLIFIQKMPWYKGEWQASFNAEFTLMHQGNTLHVAPRFAEQHGWDHGQLVKIHFEDLSVEQHHDGASNGTQQPVIATLRCDANLSEQALAYGYLDGLPANITNIAITLAEASHQEQAHYQQQLALLHQDAKDKKQRELARLKKLDQTIPIRLISGGLDDA